jgi:hypothetical protein
MCKTSQSKTLHGPEKGTLAALRSLQGAVDREHGIDEVRDQEALQRQSLQSARGGGPKDVGGRYLPA